MPNDLTEQLRKLTRILLSTQKTASTLCAEVRELAGVLAGTEEKTSHIPDDICTGEIRTANGLALSPTMASMCVGDYVRTIEFLRGTHAAIVDLRKKFKRRPVRVLYAGCGPYATLAMPLLSVFSCNEVALTLLDINEESISSAKFNVERFGFAEFVTDFETMDAAAYCISTEEPPDIILMEVMQACLESEPQVAITRHLLRQAPGAVLVPDEVRVNLELIDPSREFPTTCPESNAASTMPTRISLAPVFVLNRDTVNLWGDSCSDRIDASTIVMPESWEQQYQPMLFTEVRIYKDHVLKDYDSGLTCPRTLSLDAPIAPGATIEFVYELGAHPRLVATCGSP